jgi:hypothetical protein
MVYSDKLYMCLGGIDVTVDYSIYVNYGCETSFSYLEKDINIDLIKCFNHYDVVHYFREIYIDDNMFGNNDYSRDCEVTFNQKINIVIQIIKDIINYIDILLNTHQKRLQDYCTWYLDNNDKDSWDTYQTYIQFITCNSIINSNFEGNEIITPWKIVPFII